MNNLDLAEEVFPEYQRWAAFLELKSMATDLKRRWLKVGSSRVLAKYENPRWKVSRWDGNDVDLKWNLVGNDKNPLPIGIGLGWEFEPHLFIEGNLLENWDLMENRISEPEAKGVIETYFDLPGNRRFGSIRKAGQRLSIQIIREGEDSVSTSDPEKFSWYAGKDPEQFAAQIIYAIDRYTGDETLVGMLRRLSQPF